METRYKEVEGDLIALALQGNFDVITHGCNCQCVMGAGIAPKMAKAFGCDNPLIYGLEHESFAGAIIKLGCIDDVDFELENDKKVAVINSYTQFDITGRKDGKIDLDYEALALCLRKINHYYAGSHVGLPQIGCGLAGGDWKVVKAMIQKELKDCNVTVVIFKP